MNINNFCTYFDKNYLPQGLALYNSMKEKGNVKFHLWILCMDETTHYVLSRLNLTDITIIREYEITSFEPRLKLAKTNRPINEYYYCFTANLIRYVFSKSKADAVTYIDADMFFFSNLSGLIDIYDGADVLIIEHDFNKKLPYDHGKYNVCLTHFSNTEESLKCLNWWADKTIESTKLNNEIWGDQKYLDQFPIKFKGIKIIKPKSIGAAVWNLGNYSINKINDELYLGNEKVILFHFARFLVLNERIFLPVRRINLTMGMINTFYFPYIKEIRNSIKTIKSVYKSYHILFTYHNFIGLILGIILGRSFILIGSKLIRIGYNIKIGYEIDYSKGSQLIS